MNNSTKLPCQLVVVSKLFTTLAGILLLVLILLTVADVVGRTLIGKSILGTVDISTMLLVGIAFLGLAAAEVEGQHVVVDLIEQRLPRANRIALAVIRIFLLVGLGVILVWGLSEVLVSAIDRGETTNTILRLPTWPAKLILLVSFLLFFIVAVWRTWLDINQLRRKQNLATTTQRALEEANISDNNTTGVK